MNREINSKVYDSDILQQGMQFQIDHYYEPKDISDIIRIEMVLHDLCLERGETVLDIG